MALPPDGVGSGEHVRQLSEGAVMRQSNHEDLYAADWDVEDVATLSEPAELLYGREEQLDAIARLASDSLKSEMADNAGFLRRVIAEVAAISTRHQPPSIVPTF
jgi:hypothetical protein